MINYSYLIGNYFTLYSLNHSYFDIKKLWKKFNVSKDLKYMYVYRQSMSILKNALFAGLTSSRDFKNHYDTRK